MSIFFMMADRICALVATIALLLLGFKFSSKRLKLKKIDQFLMKIHKKTTYVLLITGALHGLLSFQSFTIAGPLVYIFGLLSLLCIIGSIVVYYKKKQLGTKWIICHGLLWLVAFLAAIFHIYLFINRLV